MIAITKRFRFEAAHQLEDWPDGHQCARLHGHSYVLELTLLATGPGRENPKPGVVLDFADVGSIVKEHIINKWDHQFLNRVLGERNTTAEFLVGAIHRILSNTHLGRYPLKIRLYETQDGWCDYE